MTERGMTDRIQSSVELTEGAALPQARVAPCSDNLPATAELDPLPAAVSARSAQEKSPAEWAYERLILYIGNFEKQLDDTQEVAMGFAGGEAGVLRIEGIGYFAPDIITFYGTEEDGTRTQLVQHVSQLNVMLRAMPKAPEVDVPRRIGFRLAAGLGPEKADPGP